MNKRLSGVHIDSIKEEGRETESEIEINAINSKGKVFFFQSIYQKFSYKRGRSATANLERQKR